MPGKICKKFAGKLKHEDFRGKLSFSHQGIFFEFSAKIPNNPNSSMPCKLQVPLGVISNFCNANNPWERCWQHVQKEVIFSTILRSSVPVLYDPKWEFSLNFAGSKIFLQDVRSPRQPYQTMQNMQINLSSKGIWKLARIFLPRRRYVASVSFSCEPDLVLAIRTSTDSRPLSLTR